MIAVAVSHDGRGGGAARLLAHLQKQDDQIVRVALTQNVPSVEPHHAVEMMLMLRDGSPRAETVLWHIAISPRRRLTANELRLVVKEIDVEFGTVSHPKLAFEHDGNPRAIEGGADHHFHLLLGHVGPNLRAINSSHFVRRLEKVMRLTEFLLGERATLGRHHVAVLKALRKEGRRDVANWLIRAFGERPDIPVARMTSGQRILAKKAQLDLPKIIAQLRRSWRDRDCFSEFVQSLEQANMTLVCGDRTGVMLLRYGGLTLGALNRFLRLSTDEALALNEVLGARAFQLADQKSRPIDSLPWPADCDFIDDELLAIEAELLGDGPEHDDPDMTDDPSIDEADEVNCEDDEMGWSENYPDKNLDDQQSSDI